MHNDLDPKKIEDLLRNVPKIEDTRTKEDVFARLKAEGLFDENENENEPNGTVLTPPVRKRLPFLKLASFVAVFTLVIIASLFINKDNMLDTADEEKIESYSISQGINDKADDKVEEAEADNMNPITMFRMSDYRTGLYADELGIGDEIIFTIGLASNAAESLPISMKIPVSFLNENGLDANASYLQIYELVAPLLDEQALGFYDYHPFEGRFEEQGERLIHYLPDDHPYDIASATLANYIGALGDTFGSHYKEVIIRNSNGEPIEFSEVGEMNDPIVLKGLENGMMNYFVFEQDNGMRYLSPNFRESFTTITDAFEDLKIEDNDIYKTAIIDDVTFDIENRETYLAVKFSQPLDVTQYEVDKLMAMFEAIIATAASFGEQVKFENIVQEEWGGFQFNEVIPKLIGLNEIQFPF